MRIKNNFIYLLTILFMCGFCKYVNASPITVTCNSWETDWQLVFESSKFNSTCYPYEYFVGSDRYVDSMCPVGVKCTSWSVSIDYRALYRGMLDTVGRGNGGLYSDVVSGIDQNFTDFRDRIIKMLDTVTLQKIYDPNMMSVNP